MFVSNKQWKTEWVQLLLLQADVVKFKSWIFEGKKFKTCIKLPKGGFTNVKNSMHKQKK